jgi:hypothetical protein
MMRPAIVSRWRSGKVAVVADCRVGRSAESSPSHRDAPGAGHAAWRRRVRLAALGALSLGLVGVPAANAAPGGFLLHATLTATHLFAQPLEGDQSLHLSTDAGLHWQPPSLFATGVRITGVSGDGTVLFGVHDYQADGTLQFPPEFVRSTDGGATFQHQPTINTALGQIISDPARPRWVWWCGTKTLPGRLVLSTDNGLAWSDRHQPACMSLAVQPTTRTGRVVIELRAGESLDRLSGALNRSTNDGRRWQRIMVPFDPYQVAFDQRRPRIAVAITGAVGLLSRAAAWRSTDAGLTWRQVVNLPTTESGGDVWSGAGQFIFTVNGVWLASTNDGASWHALRRPPIPRGGVVHDTQAFGTATGFLLPVATARGGGALLVLDRRGRWSRRAIP